MDHRWRRRRRGWSSAPDGWDPRDRIPFGHNDAGDIGGDVASLGPGYRGPSSVTVFGQLTSSPAQLRPVRSLFLSGDSCLVLPTHLCRAAAMAGPGLQVVWPLACRQERGKGLARWAASLGAPAALGCLEGSGSLPRPLSTVACCVLRHFHGIRVAALCWPEPCLFNGAGLGSRASLSRMHSRKWHFTGRLRATVAEGVNFSWPARGR